MTKTSDLFGNDTFPVELSTLKHVLDKSRVDQGMHALYYRPGTPGWKAVCDPVTPIDKAFQIYTLLLMDHYDYGPETYNPEEIWKVRDACWTQAATWLARTQAPFLQFDKKQMRELAKILPNALRAQCSIELPPGDTTHYPKDRSNKSKAIDECMDMLQHLGWNRKIRQHMLALGEIQQDDKPLPKSMGSLHDMIEYQRNTTSVPQMSLL